MKEAVSNFQAWNQRIESKCSFHGFLKGKVINDYKFPCKKVESRAYWSVNGPAHRHNSD